VRVTVRISLARSTTHRPLVQWPEFGKCIAIPVLVALARVCVPAGAAFTDFRFASRDGDPFRPPVALAKILRWIMH
jgi:hypothetical protein